MADTHSLNPFRTLVRYRNFRIFWTGQTISLVGSWMQQVAVGWLALELSNDAFVVGLVAAAGTLPILLFSLPGGMLADRADKLRVIRVAQSLMLLEATVLWWLAWTGHLTIGWLIALTSIGGLLAAFEIPARQALWVHLVDRADLPKAIGLNSMGFNLARVLGPSIAAVVIAKFGIAWTFGLNALSFLAVLIGLAMLALPASAREGGGAGQGLRAGLAEALRYVRGTAPLPALMLVAMVFSILGVPVITLLPVVARDLLGLGAEGYGALMASLGIGAMVGALAVAATGGGVRKGRTLYIASHLFPALLVVFALVRYVPLNGLLLFVVGITMIVNNALVNSRLQEVVPDALRGRVLSLYIMVYIGGAPIGSFVAGVLARAFGTAWAIGGTAGAMLVFALWVFRREGELTAH
ncbi:MAG: MFS transporter [Gemmatimonadaceae bacterium]|nr:MFS transporter [Gemmatimonadaceae bacterium]MCW5825808.1 MFS transporter [Gemmatimonadaceae bacterium]